MRQERNPCWLYGHGPGRDLGGDEIGHDNRVCPPSLAGHLDNWLRTLYHSAQRILANFIRPGDIVLDIGAGPGFFTRAMAKMVGEHGKVIAVDIQDEMLRILKEKAKKEGILSRIRVHKTKPETLGLAEYGQINFTLAFYVVHEVLDARKLFEEISDLLAPGGKVLIVEPKFHVSASEFEKSIEIARSAGLSLLENRKIFFSRAVVMQKDKKNEIKIPVESNTF